MNLAKIEVEKRYAEVLVLEFNVNKVFHYFIPENLQCKISYGSRVLVPFKRAEKIGCIVGFLTKSKIKNCKNILQIIDEESFLNDKLLTLTKWISNYYLCSWSKTLNYVLPKTKKLWTKHWKEKKMLPKSKIFKNTLESVKSSYNNLQYNLTLKPIVDSVNEKTFNVFYVNSILFSQKITFYLKCIHLAQSLKKQIIILTPSEMELIEIAQAISKKITDKILIFDEEIDPKSNYFQWINIKQSKFDIIIGKRSAVFLPLENLGFIIVDQEHDALYKEERAPRYNAVKVAKKRAQIENIPVILCSNSPSLETYHEINKKMIKPIEFFEKQKSKVLSNNQIIDMTQEKSKKKIISYSLQQAIARTIKKKKQIVLFLNRRGFSSFILCNQCGYIPKCDYCKNSLSYHFTYQSEPELICHHCGKKKILSRFCPKCGSKEMRPLGIGTQRLENEIKKMFPLSKIIRLDRDSVKEKKDYLKIIKEFNYGKIDILIGTKIAIRGICYKEVDLLGIISADTLLNLPDFRSGEKTFQLIKDIILTFKRDNESGEIIIQTFNPEHHSLLSLKEDDERTFYRNELYLRKELEYPPFTHLIKMEIKGEDKEKVKQEIKIIINYLLLLAEQKNTPKFILLGDKNMIFWKTKDLFRVQVMIKVKNIEKFNRYFLKNYDKKISGQLSKENRLLIDVDPIKMI